MPIIQPRSMAPLSIDMKPNGQLPDGRLLLSHDSLKALVRLNQINSQGLLGIKIKTLEEAVTDLFDALYQSQGISFEVKT